MPGPPGADRRRAAGWPRLAAGGLGWLLVLAALIRQRIDWDGLAFLLRVRDGDHLDPVHALYPVTLAAAVRLGAGLGLDPIAAGGLLSAVAASVFVVALAAVAVRGGLSPGRGLAVAVLVAATPDVLRESVGVEVYLPALAAVGAAACAARAAASSERVGPLIAGALAWVLAVGFHAGSVFALPWLVALAGRPRLRRLAAPAVVVAVAGGAAFVAGLTLFDVETTLINARGFIPWSKPDTTFLAELGLNAVDLGRFLVENVPWLTGVSVLSLIIVRRRRAAVIGRPAWLAVPYLAAYLVLGVPLYGLLLPPLIATGLLVASARHALRDDPRARLLEAAVAVALAGQLAGALPERWREARRPDPIRLAARELEETVPAGSAVLAGRYANHFRFHTGLRVVALPEVLHVAQARGAAPDELLATFRAAVRREADAGREVWVSSDGLNELLVRGVSVRDLMSLPRRGEPVRIHYTPPIDVIRLE